MSKILYERRVPLGEFYRRRISRVMPAFLAFVIVVFTVSATRVIAVALGLASFYFLEQPVRRWLNLHWTGKPVIGTASPQHSQE